VTIPKIIYATIHPSDTKKSWSGLNYYIANALRLTGAEVIMVSGFRCRKSFWLKLRFHLARLLGFNFYYDLTSTYGRQYAAQVDELLAADPDAVLFTVNSQLIPYLQSANKVVIYNDATYATLLHGIKSNAFAMSAGPFSVPTCYFLRLIGQHNRQ
jgi:hypothetical protein